MKKVLAVFSVMCILSVSAFAKARDDQEFIIKVGVQPQSTVSLDGEDHDTNVGISAGFEYFKYFGNIFAAGAGAVYDFPRNFQDSDVKGNISFAPMYVGAKIRTPLEGLNNNYGFLTGRLGYSAFIHDDMKDIKSSSGGLFCGVGLGVSISCLVVEAIYSISSFSYKMASKTYNESHSAITIFVGFKFE